MRLRSLILPTLAVLFAFGMGVALGAGPLHGVDATTPTGPPTSRPTPDGHFPDAAFSTVAKSIYAGGLTGQSVAIVSLPGASRATADALRGQIEAAGGTIASDSTLGVGLTTPSNKALVDSLGSQLDSQLPGIVSGGASTYSRIGQLIGDAIATTTLTPATPAPSASGSSTATSPTTAASSPSPSVTPSTPTGPATPGSSEASATTSPPAVDPATAVATIRQSLATAGLTSQIGTTAPLAPMVVVVTGRRVAPPIIAGIVDGIAAKAHNVVAMGRTRDADLASLRTAKVPVVTVDGDEYTAGRGATVLALIKQLTSGSFGASGIDGPLPFG